jgi:hypothetical protein
MVQQLQILSPSSSNSFAPRGEGEKEFYYSPRPLGEQLEVRGALEDFFIFSFLPIGNSFAYSSRSNSRNF